MQLPRFLTRLVAGILAPLLGSDSPTPAAVAPAQRGGEPAVAGPAGAPPEAAAPEAVQQLLGMGFSQAEVEAALRLTGNDVQAAVGILLNG